MIIPLALSYGIIDDGALCIRKVPTVTSSLGGLFKLSTGSGMFANNLRWTINQSGNDYTVQLDMSAWNGHPDSRDRLEERLNNAVQAALALILKNLTFNNVPGTWTADISFLNTAPYKLKVAPERAIYKDAFSSEIEREKFKLSFASLEQAFSKWPECT